MIVDQYMSTNDFLDCSKQTLRTLEFHLRDGRGNEISLNGMYITFSIVFNKYNAHNHNNRNYMYRKKSEIIVVK